MIFGLHDAQHVILLDISVAFQHSTLTKSYACPRGAAAVDMESSHMD